MATEFIVGGVDTKWSTAGNWSAGKPDAADAVTVHSAVTAINIDETAYCLSFTTAGASGAVTISGASNLSVYGDFTLTTGEVWDHTGRLYMCRQNDGTVTLNGVSLANAMCFFGYGPTATCRLAGTVTCSLFYSAGSNVVLITNDNEINCTTFGDFGVGGAVTLTLGSSTINCTNVSFAEATVTMTNHTHTININAVAHQHTNFGGVNWGTVNYHVTPTANDIIYNIDGNNCTIDTLHLHLLAAKTGTKFQLAHDIAGSVEALGNSSTNTLTVGTSSAGTHRTLTDSTGTNTWMNAVINEVNATGGATWSATAGNGCTVNDSTGWNAAAGPSIPLLMSNYRRLRAA